MTAFAKYATLPLRPSSSWLIENGYASECGMRPDYDCDGCAAAGRGRACDRHRFPGIGVSSMPCPQEVAYVDSVGHAPPASSSPQWTWKKRKGGPTAAEVAA